MTVVVRMDGVAVVLIVLVSTLDAIPSASYDVVGMGVACCSVGML